MVRLLCGLPAPARGSLAGAPRQRCCGSFGRDDRLDGVEIFYTSLLVVVGLVIAWFAFYVVYRLLQEDR